MPDFLTVPFINTPLSLSAVAVRLVLAALLGGGVALVYRRTRSAADAASTFPATLVLLSVLIAMVTQVIGDNVARAFSLVGALSIVRFRTVVRDTQDTAFVIFAVAVGMAIGANNAWVAVLGIVVVGITAFLMRPRSAARRSELSGPLPYLIRARVGLGNDIDALIGGALDTYVTQRRLQAIETAKQGISIDVSYEAALKSPDAAEQVVKALNRLEGVQSVSIERRETFVRDI